MIKPGALCLILCTQKPAMDGRFCTIVRGPIRTTVCIGDECYLTELQWPLNGSTSWYVATPCLRPIDDPDAFPAEPTTTRIPEIEGHTG